MSKKSLYIYGSTGSIGQNALEVIRQNHDLYSVDALIAGNNYQALILQAKEFNPKYIGISNKEHYQTLKKELPNCHIIAGEEEINNLAQNKCDLFLSAIVGIKALIPTLNAIKAGSNIAIANKECLVSAGEIIMKEVKKNNVNLIPIDSEHNAIYQIFEYDNLDLIDHITLTASGGPFLDKSLEELKNVTIKQAINHPNWSMGQKISIDSATMMNKGLEVIEAAMLFPVNNDQINVLIHPESIIHGLVSYCDGATLAMMNPPDMKVPISYALKINQRLKIKYPQLNLSDIARLNFSKPDIVRFKALKLAFDTLKEGGNKLPILNAANELAVGKFLKEEIKFLDIIDLVEDILNKFSYQKIDSLDDILYYDRKVRELN
ncbi:1-deoxy-D-xylulose-5-phosphate reductoisomerase [Rickettsiales bacterium]|nr:1-deoxy-D-xylulose-5-phosphate reductoisomerase [Rickettsiales bacterium]MDB2550435.1 1-deoxy-D-xylulose-5-phosphate reductoisomerase [Rickettsiales bacterium]